MSNSIQIKKILEKYNKFPKKSLGQNFLINSEIPKKTAELCFDGCPEQTAGVLEIGPGLGILTRELCGLFKKVVAVEIDRTFEPALKEISDEFENLEIIYGDMLKIDLSGFENFCVCANLPYYITTPAILKLIKSGVKFSNITVMIQKEAADKLCSKAGGENYCAASAIISYFGEAKKIFNVAKSNFYPQPNVLSTVVKITPYVSPAANPKSIDLMFKVIDAAFEQRRKTLVNALASGLNLEKDKVSDIVLKITGKENIRGEELDIKAFADISDLIF